jgi:acetyltransferase-like isoleucine patch superfamily enzyme
MYSGMQANRFSHCGKGFSICFPAFLIGGKSITIGKNFRALTRLRLEAFKSHNGKSYKPKVRIGDNVSINHNCHIGCVDSIDIGSDVLIASNVFVTDHFHGETDMASLLLPPSDRPLITKGAVVIEDCVWVGENVSILPGVRIGKGSVIGANSVVTKSFSPYSIIGGVPARLLRSPRVEDPG